MRTTKKSMTTTPIIETLKTTTIKTATGITKQEYRKQRHHSNGDSNYDNCVLTATTTATMTASLTTTSTMKATRKTLLETTATSTSMTSTTPAIVAST